MTQILTAETSDGTAVTIYTDPIQVARADILNTHFEWDDAAADYASTVTLWASNKPTPGTADDVDWVEMTSDHGFSGLPGGNPAGGDGKDMVDFSAFGALWYRWKIAHTAGAATIDAYICERNR